MHVSVHSDVIFYEQTQEAMAGRYTVAEEQLGELSGVLDSGAASQWHRSRLGAIMLALTSPGGVVIIAVRYDACTGARVDFRLSLRILLGGSLLFAIAFGRSALLF